MLLNYEKLSNGVIRQINSESFVYDINYINKSYKEDCNQLRMASLRWGHLIGSLGFIPKKVLDVGYGSGTFIKQGIKHGVQMFGYDISNYPLPEGATFKSNMFDEKYDVITFYDSLEHFKEINFVKNLKSQYIIVSLPWCHYLSDEWFENWKHRKPNEHLWHFNDKSLTAFMYSNGFRLVSTTNIEDAIRTPYDLTLQNILTAVYVKC